MNKWILSAFIVILTIFAVIFVNKTFFSIKTIKTIGLNDGMDVVRKNCKPLGEMPSENLEDLVDKLKEKSRFSDSKLDPPMLRIISKDNEALQCGTVYYRSLAGDVEILYENSSGEVEAVIFKMDELN